MGIESFDNGHFVKRTDISNSKLSANEKNFFEKMFDKLDTDGDGVLDYEKEGAICIFDDGAISAMKSKSQKSTQGGTKIESIFIAGRTSDGVLAEVKDDNTTEYTYRDGSIGTADANNNILKGKLSNGVSFTNIKNSKGEFLYKEYTTKNGDKYLLSFDNKKFAKIEPDGGLRTSPVEGDSFDGTMIRLGIKDPELIEMVRNHPNNKHVFENKHDYFAINWDFTNGDVYIPPEVAKTLDLTKALADNHNVDALIKELNAPSENKAEETNTEVRSEAKEFASQVRDESNWVLTKPEEPVTAEPPMDIPDATPVIPVKKEVKKSVEDAPKEEQKPDKAALKAENKAAKLRAKQDRKAAKAEAKRVKAEKRAAAKAEAEKTKAEERKKAAQAKDAKAAEAEKAKELRKASTAAVRTKKQKQKYILDDKFRNMIKNLRTGVNTVPKYTIDENGVVNRKSASVSVYKSEIFNAAGRGILLQDKEGFYHKGPLKYKNANVLNQKYQELTSNLSIDTEIYKQLSEKSELSESERLFMQKHEQRMIEFFNSIEENK